jgi:PAS domain S-box-containing protein
MGPDGERESCHGVPAPVATREGLQRAYAALAGCNRALVRATDEVSLFRDVCRALVEQAGYVMAWVGRAEHDPERTVRCVADFGASAGYLDAVRIRWADVPEGRGPTGTAIRTRTTRVNRDSTSEAGYGPWRAQALERGFASSIALPLVVGGEVFGALTVYCAEVDGFEGAALELVERMAEDLAYGIGALRERAARARAEAERAASEELFRSAFENASIGKALTDVDGRFVRVNPALCAMLGRTADELVGLTFFDVTHPDDRAPSDVARRAAVVGESGGLRLRKRYLHRDGHVVWGEVASSLVRAADGSPRHFIAGVLDVTERVVAEQQLRQAQKMEAVGRFCGSVAHDFNNLLSVILSGCELALDEDAVDVMREEVVEVLEAARMARSLSQQLLAFSRARPAEPREIDLAALVGDSRRMLALLLGRGAELVLDVAPRVGVVMADPAQFQHVLFNLVANARDAMPAGGAVTVAVADARAPEDVAFGLDAVRGAPCVCVAVTDTGEGMDPEVVRRIFEPFFTTKPIGRGTGLGLATVRGLVEEWGGAARVESAPGRGTRFEIYLRRVPGPA